MFKQIANKLKTARGFTTGLIAGVLLTATVTTAFAATPIKEALVSFYNDITIYVNGALFQSSIKDAKGEPVYPIIYEGRTYLPIAAIAEAFDVPVAWEGETRSIFLGTKPGETQYMTDILPAYQSSNKKNYTEYSAIKSIAATGKAAKFSLGGVEYTDGFTLESQGTWAVWNLNGQYSSLDGVLCHLDGSDSWDSQSSFIGTNKPEYYVLQVYFDDVIVQEIPVYSDMAVTEIALNVKGVNQLKLQLGKTGTGVQNLTVYGIGNPVLK